MRQFNIRVYGIVINDREEILLSTERRKGFEFTKFPGGGLEFGEGTRDCLERELQEELNAEAVIGDLFYLTDFFQPSAFHPDHQIISVYYFAEIPEWTKIPICELEAGTGDQETFRWVSIQDLGEELFTFPIDRVVCRKLMRN